MAASFSRPLFLSFQFLCCGTAPAALWTAGHGDLTLRYTSGPQPLFSYVWNAGDGGEPATVDGMEVFNVSYPSAELTPVVSALTVPSPDALLTGGGHLHLVPQDGTDAAALGSPFQGWSTGIIPGGLFTGNQARLLLTGVTGPGAVSLWSDDGFGGTGFSWASVNGFTSEDALVLKIGGHSHFNLGFTWPGDYELRVLAEAALSAGGTVSTPLTLRYHVVPEPSMAALLTLVLMAGMSRRRIALKSLWRPFP